MKPPPDLIEDGASKDKMGLKLRLPSAAEAANPIIFINLVVSLSTKLVRAHSKRIQRYTKGINPVAGEVPEAYNNLILNSHVMLCIKGHPWDEAL